jgi:hypothetical protein
MKITSNVTGKTHVMGWRGMGWSYAVPLVRREGFCMPWNRWQEIDGHAIPYLAAKGMLPNDMRAWFQRALDSRDALIKAWQAEMQK